MADLVSILNSTIGVPSQLVLRTLRALKDPKIDLLSEEGLLDQSLIPVIGMWDDERHDAWGTDIVGEDHPWLGFGLEVATDPLFFMASPLTAGAKANRAIQVISRNKALRGHVENVLSPAVNEGRAKGLDFIDAAKARLGSTGNFARGERSALSGAVRDLQEFAADKVADIAKNGTKRELALGLPGLVKFGAYKTIPTEEKSWFKLLANGAFAPARWAGIALHGGLTRIPYIADAIKPVENTFTGFWQGFTQRAKPAQRLSAAAVEGSPMTPEEAATFITAENTTLLGRVRGIADKKGKSVGARFDERMEVMGLTEDALLELIQKGNFEQVAQAMPALDKAKLVEKLTQIKNQKHLARARSMVKTLLKKTDLVPDQHQAILSSLGIPTAGKTASQMRTEVRDLMERFKGDRDFMADALSGKGDIMTGRDLDEILGDWAKNMDSAQESLSNAEILRKPAEGLEKAFDGFARKANNLGKDMRKWVRKAFKSDVPVEELEPIERALVAARAGFSERAMSIGKELLIAAEEISKDIGVPTKQVESALRNWLEGSFGNGEIGLWMKHLHTGGAQADAAVNSMLSFLSRSSAALPALGKVLKAMGVEDAAKLERLFPGDEARRFVHGERPVERALSDIDPNVPNWMGEMDALDPTHRLGPGPNSRRLAGGTFQGEYLGHLTDTQLANTQRGLTRQGMRKFETEEILQHIEGDEGLARLRDKYDLSLPELRRVIKRAQSGKPFQIRRTGKRITESEMADIRAFASRLNREDLAIISGKAQKFDYTTLRDLDPALAQDYDAVEQLIKLRADGTMGQMEKARAFPAEPIVGSRKFAQDSLRDEVGRFTASNQIQRGFYRLAAMTHDLRRYLDEVNKAKAIGRKPYIDQGFIDAFEEMATELNGGVETLLREGLGEGADKMLTAMRTLQKENMMQALRLGLLDHGGAPLGYVSRLMSNSSREALRELGLVAAQTDIIQRLAPVYSDSFARSWDNFTIDELNTIYDEALKLDKPELANRMKEILTDEGLFLEKFESSPIDIFVNKLGQMQKRGTVAEFMDDVIADGADMQIMGGRIVGVVDDQGKQTKIVKHDIGVEFEGTRAEIIEKNKEIIRGATGIVLEQADGTQRFIRAESLGQGFSLTTYGHIGNTVGEAAAVNLTRKGKYSPIGDQGPLKALSPEQMEDIMGDWAVFGADSVSVGAYNAVASQVDNAQGFLRGFDSVNYFLRKFQTVFRPAFHVSNLASGYFQTLNLGVSPSAATAGHMDAFRVLFGGDKSWISSYDRYSALIGEARLRGVGIGSAPEVVGLARRVGPDGVGHVDRAEDLVLDLGRGQEIAVSEILNVSGKHGLFGTFLARGFEGGASTPSALKNLRKDVENSGTLIGRLKQKFGPQLETGEVAGRLGAVFAQLREGKPLEEAVIAAKKAMVDYADLTNFERKFAKRTALYYTFARKFMPHAWRQFGADPRGIATAAKAINDAGLVTTVNGQVELKVVDYRTSLQRAAAPLDALMLLPAAAERLAFAAHGPEQLTSTRPPAFLATGGVASILGFGEMFEMDPRPSQGWFDEMIYSTFATKWVAQGLSGEGRGPLDELTKFLIPLRQVDPGHEQRILINNYSRLLGDIKRKFQETDSTWRREALRSEAKELQRGLKDLLAIEKKWPANIADIRKAIEAIVSEEF